MSLAVNEFKKAVYTRLNGNIATGNPAVYNHVPQNSSYPYVRIGNETVIMDDMKTTDAQEITITVDIFSRAAGDKQAADIAEDIYALLHHQESSLSLSGFTVTLIRMSDFRIVQDTVEAGQDKNFHGIMRFTATVETN